MAYNGFAIDKYLNAEEVTRQLDELIKKPVYSIRPDKLDDYVENYFEKKCAKSKEMIEKAKEVIPGGVQHNLAFNYPFPIVINKAEGAKLYDIDGNWYYDLLQAGGPTILGSNPSEVRERVIDLLNTCGPSTGLFHEYEYKLAKKISEMVPSVQKFRMLGSGTEACMCAARIARLKTGKKNILKMGGAYHGWSDQLAYGIRVPGTKDLCPREYPGSYSGIQMSSSRMTWKIWRGSSRETVCPEARQPSISSRWGRRAGPGRYPNVLSKARNIWRINTGRF